MFVISLFRGSQLIKTQTISMTDSPMGFQWWLCWCVRCVYTLSKRKNSSYTLKCIYPPWNSVRTARKPSQREISSSNHPFSGARCYDVTFREGNYTWRHTSPNHLPNISFSFLEVLGCIMTTTKWCHSRITSSDWLSCSDVPLSTKGYYVYIVYVSSYLYLHLIAFIFAIYIYTVLNRRRITLQKTKKKNFWTLRLVWNFPNRSVCPLSKVTHG